MLRPYCGGRNSLNLRLRFAVLIGLALWLAGCRAASPAPGTPMPAPVCAEPGTTALDHILIPDENRSLTVTIYRPPCYDAAGRAAYPVLYWTMLGAQALQTSDQLIQQGELAPFILVSLETDLTDGPGADGRIIRDVVPFVDAHYRTLADARHRSIAGISAGGAIAARAALQPPDLFGRVAVISGGIAEAEQDKFATWLAETPPAERPAILIDVGDQDGIIMLTHYLTGTLDKGGVPYTFTHAPGDHAFAYWAAHMPAYLKWLMSRS